MGDGFTFVQVQDGTHAVTVMKFITAMFRCLLRSRPLVPTLSRWTTTGPAVDFYLLNITTLKVCIRATVDLSRRVG